MTNTPEINEFYKVLLENQNNTLQLVSFIILSITVLLLGASFLWNFYFSNKKIEKAINFQKTKLEELINNRVAEIEIKVKKEIKSELEENICDLRIDNARIFGVYCSQNKWYDTSLTWWFTCLENSIKSDGNKYLRIAINSITHILNISDFTEYDPKVLDIKKCKKISMEIPNILKPEKEIILKKIEKLKEKKTDE